MIHKQNQYGKQEPLGCLALDVSNEMFNIILPRILYFWKNKSKQNADLDDISVSLKKKTF